MYTILHNICYYIPIYAHYKCTNYDLKNYNYSLILSNSFGILMFYNWQKSLR